MSQILTAVGTAVLSSLLTVVFLWALYERRIRGRLEARVKELEVELDLKMAEFRRQMGEVVRDRVRQGIVDGVSSIPSAEVFRGTGKTLSESAGEFLRGGLSSLLGGGPRDDGEEEDS